MHPDSNIVLPRVASPFIFQLFSFKCFEIPSVSSGRSPLAEQPVYLLNSNENSSSSDCTAAAANGHLLL